MTEKFETYLCEYPYQGSHWGFEIKATSRADALARLKALAWAEVKGEMVMKIPVPGGTAIHRLLSWLRGSQ